MTDTLEVGRITQLTETGHVTMYPKLERREWIFGTAPDPRDARIAELTKTALTVTATAQGLTALCLAREARIAELEAALRDIGTMCIVAQVADDEHLREMFHNVRLFIERKIPPPERDMTITHEELSV